MTTITPGLSGLPPRPLPPRRRYRIGSLTIEPLSREVHFGGTPVHLTKIELRLLMTLADEPTRMFTREELLDSVWGITFDSPTRVVHQYMSRLRHRLAEAGADPEAFLFNRFGQGYRLLATIPDQPDEDCCPTCGKQLRT